MQRSGSLAWVRALWAGELPLAVAFWHFGILYGLLVNAFTTVAGLALVAADLPAWLAAVVFFLSAPYNLLVLVGVWRSAGRWEGQPIWADSARIAIVLWTMAATAL